MCRSKFFPVFSVLLIWVTLSAVCLGTTYYIDGTIGSDLNNGLSPQTAFATIQKGINTAQNGDTVLVLPWTYHEALNLLGKAITLQGDPPGAIITAGDSDFAITMDSGENNDTVVKNFIIKGSYIGVYCGGTSPVLTQLTIINNHFGIKCSVTGHPEISNCILWDNDTALSNCSVTYSDIQGGSTGQGNINVDPCFVAPQLNDYHLLSTADHFAKEPLWSQPGLHAELNSDTKYAYEPCLSRDKLTMYFARYCISTHSDQIYTASRSVPYGPFGTPVRIGDFGNLSATTPCITADGLRLYMSRRTNTGSHLVLMMAQRSNLTSPWHIAKVFDELHTSGYDDVEPTLTDDELTIFWESGRPGSKGSHDIWMATRGSVADAFSAPVNVSEINTSAYEAAPCVMPDGLTLYYCAYRQVTGHVGIYKAVRGSLTMPFVTVATIQGSGISEYDNNKCYVTPDEKQIYFLSRHGSSLSEQGIWVINAIGNNWVIDRCDSPCIDAGNPASNPMAEPQPNGGRVNMGAFGATVQASKSPNPWPNRADLNKDGVVDLRDFMIISENWLWQAPWVDATPEE